MEKQDIPLKVDMEFQRIWSDRLVGANAKDYMSIMEKINSRKYFPKSMQEEIENIFKGTVKIVSLNMLVKRWFYRIRIDKKLVYYR